jgi:hypothetical protein
MDEKPVVLSEEERALAREVGRELGRAYRASVAYYRNAEKLSPAEAAARAAAVADDDHLGERLAGTDPKQIWWSDLFRLQDLDPDACKAVWDRLVAEARDELASGFRAMAPFEFDNMPYDRARFLVLRAAFRDEWQPRGGIEDGLIDTLAQSWQMYEAWMGRLHVQMRVDPTGRRRDEARGRTWAPPTVSEAEAVEQSAAMAERFNRMQLRTLRALRDLRRFPVIVASAGQVNIAEKQVNVNGSIA